MLAVLGALIKDKSAVTAIEYALIAGFVGIAAVVAIGSIGSTLSTIFYSVSTGI